MKCKYCGVEMRQHGTTWGRDLEYHYICPNCKASYKETIGSFDGKELVKGEWEK